jgi:hypothetical protein
MVQRPEKNGRNRSINKATKNRQSSATAKRRAGAKGLMCVSLFLAYKIYRTMQICKIPCWFCILTFAGILPYWPRWDPKYFTIAVCAVEPVVSFCLCFLKYKMRLKNKLIMMHCQNWFENACIIRTWKPTVLWNTRSTENPMIHCTLVLKQESRHGYPRVQNCLLCVIWVVTIACVKIAYPATRIDSNSQVIIPYRAAKLGLPSKLPLQTQITPPSSSSPTKLDRTPFRTSTLTFVLWA